MTDLDALRKQKEKLLLEREIEILQCQSSRALAVSRLRWTWVVPLGFLGLAVMVGGIAANFPNDLGVGIAWVSIGALLTTPLLVKLILGR